MPAPVTLDALLEALNGASSSEALVEATWALARRGDAAAAPALVDVLGYNNPGAAVAAVDGLVALGAAAVDPLLRLDPENYGARAWAVRALAGIGDVRGLEVLIDALGSDVAASVRRAAAKGLGTLELDHLAPETRQTVQLRCLNALVAAAVDGEWVVRYAVAVGLESLARTLVPGSTEARQRLDAALAALCDEDDGNPPVVRLRARMALDRLVER